MKFFRSVMALNVLAVSNISPTKPTIYTDAYNRKLQCITAPAQWFCWRKELAFSIHVETISPLRAKAYKTAYLVFPDSTGYRGYWYNHASGCRFNFGQILDSKRLKSMTLSVTIDTNSTGYLELCRPKVQQQQEVPA